MSTLTIRPRSEWTTAPEGFSYALTAANVVGAAIHYPGDGNVTRLGTSEATSKALLAAYRRYHVSGRGWADIGYNVAVDQAGRCWWAAGRKKAAHCASTKNPYANARYVGILLLIGNTETPSAAMIATVNAVLQQLNADYVFDAGQILGHRQVYGASTSCPGDKVIALLAAGTIGLHGSTSVGTIAAGQSSSTSTTTATKNASAHRTYTSGEVLAIQEKLAGAGFYGGLLDGDYGPATEAAVVAYQRAQLYGSLVADGDWGPTTEAHYQWVIALQKALNGWKSSYADLVVDGSYGTLTARRVRDIQTRNKTGAYKQAGGSVADGVPGPVTCSMLGIPTHP